MKAGDKLSTRLKNYVPPGVNLIQEIKYYGIAMVISTLWAFTFLFRYFEERERLFVKRLGKLYLREGIMMPSFEILTENLFDVFYLTIIFTFIIVVYHYFYHYQGSKIIYLMKRLPNKRELHIRCWTLPMLGCVITIVFMTILKILFYLIYVLGTPSQCLPM